MSTYNGEKYLREQIDSILFQNGDFEINLCVRDDGSTDSTIDILKSYEERKKLTWYTGDNLRSAKSFLTLVQKYRGYDFYAFSDQDDYWFPDKLSNGIERLKDVASPALYFSNAELVNSQLNTLGRNVYQYSPKIDFKTLSCAGGVLGCTMIFNRSLAEYIQIKDIPQHMVMHDFYIALLCSALEGKILYNSIPSMKYRQHGANVVGVAFGKIGILRNRIKAIIQKSPNSIAEQANEVLRLYSNEISESKRKWLYKIGTYNKSFVKRLQLCFSRETKYVNVNMAIRLRISILLGNR